MSEKQLEKIARIFLISKNLVVIGKPYPAIVALGLKADFESFLLSFVTMS